MSTGRDVSLNELFKPRSIAVVGASNKPGSVGASVFNNIIQSGFQGIVYPVNPARTSVSGVRCYPDVSALPEVPDLGVLIVPAPIVPRVAEEFGKAGSKSLIVISAGFREIGGEGVAREEELVRIVRKYQMSVVGPNCFGVLNTDPSVRLNATFSDSLPQRGNIAFVSQSGALCSGILRYGVLERIGFSRFVSVGNRAGVDENDLLLSLAQDDATRVILLYIESLADARRFLETAHDVTEKKPVFVIKSGRTVAGERAAKSHTGSLAQSGRDKLYDALFEQAGVLRLESTADLFRAAKVFASGQMLEGPRLAILTNSGGPGIVAADAAERRGLILPPLQPEIREKLARLFTPSASVANPVDMTGEASPAQFREGVATLLSSPEINGLVVITTSAAIIDFAGIAGAIITGRGSSRKPVVTCAFGLNDLSKEVVRLESSGIPTFAFPEESVAALGDLYRYWAWRTRPKSKVKEFEVDRTAVKHAIARARAEGITALPSHRARELFAAYGIHFPQARQVTRVDEAVAAAEAIGFPVVLKVVSPDILHKTDVGGLMAGLNNASAVRMAWSSVHASLAARAPDARIEGFQVEAMITAGKEVIVGAQDDPVFGPVVMFGMGGVYVEALKDVTFRLSPMRTRSAQMMNEEVRGSALLKGVRGEPPSDVDALCEAIERISQLITQNPEISELDLNPIIVRAVGQGVVAVDARVVLK
jgi:acetyl coenzyme A synthetase (ADP forming)-like protein